MKENWRKKNMNWTEKNWNLEIIAIMREKEGTTEKLSWLCFISFSLVDILANSFYFIATCSYWRLSSAPLLWCQKASMPLAFLAQIWWSVPLWVIALIQQRMYDITIFMIQSCVYTMNNWFRLLLSSWILLQSSKRSWMNSSSQRNLPSKISARVTINCMTIHISIYYP